VASAATPSGGRLAGKYDLIMLCVAATDPRMAHLRDITDVPAFDQLEIQHFFEVYKALEPGKQVEAAAWVGVGAAEAEIEACRDRLANTPGHPSA